MKLTGKCEQEFEKWFKEEYSGSGIVLYNHDLDQNFYHFFGSMQYGVYVDFFESVAIYITLKLTMEGFEITLNCRNQRVIVWEDVRPEARTAAIEKADEIFNKREV